MLDTVLQIRVNRKDRRLISQLAKRWRMSPSTISRGLLMREVVRAIKADANSVVDLEKQTYNDPVTEVMEAAE